MKAFPEVKYVKSGEFGSHVMTIEGGMDLRDYFAAQALNGAQVWDAVLNGKNSEFIGKGPEMLAKVAYAIADEMMKARDAKS